MPALHEVKRIRATKRAELAEAKAKYRTAKAALLLKVEELPAGDPVPPDDVSSMDTLQAQVDSIEAECDALDARIAVLEQLQDNDSNEAEEIDQPGSVVDASFQDGVQRGLGDNKGPRMTPHGYGEPARQNEKGFFVARMMIGQAWVKRGLSWAEAAAQIERRFGDKAVAKALNTAGTSTGGALIPQNFRGEMIDLLRAKTVVRKMDPTFYPMSTGNMTISRLAGAATASYGGELDAIQVSQQTFDVLQLNAKKMSALVAVTNDLIRRTPSNIERVIIDDLVQVMALKEDLAFILADGSLGTPIGLYNQCAGVNKLIVPAFTATDNATMLTAVVSTSNAMKLTLKNNMAGMVRPGWIMSPVTEAFLRGLRDGVGNFVYKDEMDGGKFDGLRFEVTQQLPTNINTAAAGATPVNNGAFLILADFVDVIVADTMEYQLDIFDQATYVVGGQTVSAVQMDQTVFRVIQEHDLAMQHQGSIVVAALPGWSPAGFTNFSGGQSYYVQALSGDMSAAPSTWGTAAPSGSNNPANIASNVAGGQLPGRP